MAVARHIDEPVTLTTPSLVMFTGPGFFEDGTYCEWPCAAVGAARLVDQTRHLSPPLDYFLANAQDKAGHVAIRTVKRWVVLPIADLPQRLHHLV